MPENKQPRHRDLETLSAYLDGMLNERETRALNVRLQQQEGLRVALEDLQIAKAALNSLPDVRLPRNFTLTPDMVGLRRHRRSFLFMRTATAFAVLTFVISIGFDTLSRFAVGSSASGVMDAAPMAMEEMEAPALLEQAEEGLAADSINALPEEAPPAMESLGEQTFAGGAEDQGIVEGEERSADEEVVEEIAEVEVVPDLAPTVIPTGEPGKLDGTEVHLEPQPASIVEAPVVRIPTIRWVEITAGVLALVFFLITRWLRRRS